MQELCQSFVEEDANTVGSGIGIDLRAFPLHGYVEIAPLPPRRIGSIMPAVTHTHTDTQAEQSRGTDRRGEQVAGRGGKPATHSCGSTSTSTSASALPGEKRANSIWVASGISEPRSGFCQGGTRSLAPSTPASLACNQGI